MKAFNDRFSGRLRPLNVWLMISAGLFCSCESRYSVTEARIAGTYAREFSFEVTHLETGNQLGRSTVRDTLFIQKRSQGYEVRQTKWRLNDFDQQGWRDQIHADDRPTPAYEATFGQADRCLRPSSPGWAVPLFLKEDGTLYEGNNRQRPYRQVP